MNKFRVYDNKNNKLHTKNFVVDTEGVLYQKNKHFVKKVEKEDYTIQENTNQKDTQNQEIFVGDIINFKVYDYTSEIEVIREVPKFSGEVYKQDKEFKVSIKESNENFLLHKCKAVIVVGTIFNEE